MKTKAAILVKSNSPLVIDDVEIPALKKGQVLVKILVSGICRAQYNEIIALKGPDRYLPHLLGHEAAGLLQDIGAGVKKVKKGDYVICSWIKGKGLDALRSEYQLNGQVINAGSVTTFSDLSVVSENRVTKIIRKAPAEIAAIIGCAVATGAGIVNNTLKAVPGSSIAVFGVGGVGLSAIMAAKAAHCKKVIAVDTIGKKLEFAKKLGATHVVNPTDGDALSRIRQISNGGTDYAIDASGAKPAMETAFEALNTKGILVIAGNLSIQEKISLHPFELIKGKRILGTWGGETDPQKDFPKYIREYMSGRMPLDKLITHRFRLEDINKAFDVLIAGEAGRIIIDNRMG